MAQIKQKRRPAVDYPSGRGTGLPAAGVHAVDRKLGALPVDFRLQGASGQPSTSADSGYSRGTYQRINRGFEKALESIPEVSWLKQNAEQLNAMGLSPRVVAEMYKTLCDHVPKNERERQLLAETHTRVLRTRRRVTSVTRAALHEANGRSLYEFLDASDLSAGVRTLVSKLPGSDVGQALSDESETAIKQQILRGSDPELGGGIVTQTELDTALESPDVTSGVLACNSNSLEILQTALAITGVVGDVGIAAGIPVGMASDITNASINIMCKHYFHALLDVIAVIPFAGDFAKVFYAKRLLKRKGIDTAVLGAGTIAQQADEAAKVIENFIKDRTVGPKMSGVILRLRSTYKTASGLADHLTSVLRSFLTRAIGHLENIKKGAQSGSITMKGANWALSKLPVDLLEVLTRIRDNGLEGFREFVEHLFSRKSTQSTASFAQAKAPVERLAGEEMKSEEEEQQLQPGLAPVQGFKGYLGPEEMPGYGTVPYGLTPMQPGQATPQQTDDFVFEAKTKKKKLSLVKSLNGDDSAIDEMSTVATSLGTPGAPGGGGYVERLGQRPPGPPRRKLDKLVPGYEFARGRYPYSY